MKARGQKGAPDLSSAFAIEADELNVLTTWLPSTTEVVLRVATADVEPSPFQPRGRPSPRAVRAASDALAAAGGVAALRDQADASPIAGLDAESRALLELALDVADNGVESALEARRVGERLELLSGHRRLAAARLAGLADVPVVDRGPVDDHVAAAIVYRRNLLRKDFTAWQEATSFAAIQRNRRAAGQADSVRAVARALGTSHGRAGDLLTIARAFDEDVLAAIADDRDLVEDALARLTFRTLRDLATLPSVAERVEQSRLAAGLAASARAPRLASAAERTERRGGGYTLTVRKAPERMTAAEARDALAVLDAESARLRMRLSVLASPLRKGTGS
jgi:ParB family transcriptional regulator, chromosome partitioning protein